VSVVLLFINLIGSSTQHFDDDFDFSSVDGDQVLPSPRLRNSILEIIMAVI
jgi:hypothetical protein